jgi:histidinol phosphatase-like enzyme
VEEIIQYNTRKIKMKVIFFDIDGVIVTKRHLLHLEDKGELIADQQHRHFFDPECVKQLASIIDATGAKIVLTSAWRYLGKEVMRSLWNERVMPGEIFDFTPKTNHDVRGAEINMWLRPIQFSHDPVESFVIIDDDISDLLIGQSNRVVKTTWKTGLTEELAAMAIRILNTPRKEEEESL